MGLEAWSAYKKTHAKEASGAKLEPSRVISVPGGSERLTSHGVKEVTAGAVALLKTVSAAGADHSPPPSWVRLSRRVPI